jgi:hypothetical protein
VIVDALEVRRLRVGELTIERLVSVAPAQQENQEED